MLNGLRTPWQRLILVGVPCAFALWMAMPTSTAMAHSVLRSSSPAAGAKLQAPPNQIVLVYSEPIEAKFANVFLTVGDQPPQSIPVTINEATVTAKLQIKAASGLGRLWKVNYRVVSADGHPIEGTVAFTIAPAVASAPLPPGLPLPRPHPQRRPPTPLRRDPAPPSRRAIHLAPTSPGHSSSSAD